MAHKTTQNSGQVMAMKQLWKNLSNFTYNGTHTKQRATVRDTAMAVCKSLLHLQ